MSTINNYKLKAFATQGVNGDDENRLKTLLSNFNVEYYPFEKKSKLKSLINLMKNVLREKSDLIIMEGTGIGGGLPLILASIVKGTPFIVSSGDPVGPFIRKKSLLLGSLFQIYEKLLYKKAIGFVGWTPYLTGRALSYGSKYAITAAGWAPFIYPRERLDKSRIKIREKYGIPEHNIVIGIVGSLNWNKKIGYCYGYEIVKAISKIQRDDITAFIIGDGTGLNMLREIAEQSKYKNIIFAGRVPREEVPDYLASMDLASLPQSVDQLGSFRYTTKVSEYLSIGLPIITGMIPMSYDLNESNWIIRMKGNYPWSETYINNLLNFCENLDSKDIVQYKKRVPQQLAIFNKEYQVKQITEFIEDILEQN